MNWLKLSLGQWPPGRYNPQLDEFNRTTHRQQEERDRGLAHIFGYEDVPSQPAGDLIDGTILMRNSDCDSEYRTREQHVVTKEVKIVRLKGIPDTDRLVEVHLSGKLVNPKFWSYNPRSNEILIELTSIFPKTMQRATLEAIFCDTIPF